MSNQSNFSTNLSLFEELASTKAISIIRKLLDSNVKRAVASCIIAALAYYFKVKFNLHFISSLNIFSGTQIRGLRGDMKHVDTIFMSRIFNLLKIIIPNTNCVETRLILVLSLALISRTLLSINIASVNGKIVSAILKTNIFMFAQRILILGFLAIPAAVLNSSIEYFTRRLEIRFRERMYKFLNDMILDSMGFYKITNLDNRISNPDSRMTQDVDKWAALVSTLFTSFAKPLLDIFLFSIKLSSVLGVEGPLLLVGWYLFTGLVIKFLSPSFSRMIEINQKLESNYRNALSDLIEHSEEIAFYKGSSWEKRKIENLGTRLFSHARSIIYHRYVLSVFDNILVKYGASLMGYAIVALPIIGPRSADNYWTLNKDTSLIGKDLVKNSHLLTNLAKAIGKIVGSYKDLQNLAGYTNLLYDLVKTLEELKKNHYERKTIWSKADSFTISLKNIMETKGTITNGDNLIFENVPIITPSGETLIESISFEICPGMNTFICGPNGCGKSSLFRILGGLWPLMGGKITRPESAKMFYIPQRPYMPMGTLRDQIIYPDKLEDMKAKGINNDDLLELIGKVKLTSIIEREGGWDKINDWSDVLSGGEKQRIAIARVFYHKPLYAILDECTSAVSMDTEELLYSELRESKITLISITHRESVKKFHDYKLEIMLDGKYLFSKIGKIH